MAARCFYRTKSRNNLDKEDTYQHNFYVLPKGGNTGADLFQILSQQSVVKKVEWEDKFTDLFDYDRYGMKRLICVYPESLLCYKTLLKRLEKDPRVAQLFNTDLLHVQQYLFTKLKIEPTNKVEVQYDKNESRLIKITKIDEDLAAEPPPFSILYFEIHTTSSMYNLGDDLNDAITDIRARYQHEPDINTNQKSHLRAARIVFSKIFPNMFRITIQIFSFLQTSILEAPLFLILYV
jgi:hypothetical protein